MKGGYLSSLAPAAVPKSQRLKDKYYAAINHRSTTPGAVSERRRDSTLSLISNDGGGPVVNCRSRSGSIAADRTGAIYNRYTPAPTPVDLKNGTQTAPHSSNTAAVVPAPIPISFNYNKFTPRLTSGRSPNDRSCQRRSSEYPLSSTTNNKQEDDGRPSSRKLSRAQPKPALYEFRHYTVLPPTSPSVPARHLHSPVNPLPLHPSVYFGSTTNTANNNNNNTPSATNNNQNDNDQQPSGEMTSLLMKQVVEEESDFKSAEREKEDLIIVTTSASNDTTRISTNTPLSNNSSSTVPPSIPDRFDRSNYNDNERTEKQQETTLNLKPTSLKSTKNKMNEDDTSMSKPTSDPTTVARTILQAVKSKKDKIRRTRSRNNTPKKNISQHQQPSRSPFWSSLTSKGVRATSDEAIFAAHTDQEVAEERRKFMGQQKGTEKLLGHIPFGQTWIPFDSGQLPFSSGRFHGVRGIFHSIRSRCRGRFHSIEKTVGHQFVGGLQGEAVCNFSLEEISRDSSKSGSKKPTDFENSTRLKQRLRDLREPNHLSAKQKMEKYYSKSYHRNRADSWGAAINNNNNNNNQQRYELSKPIVVTTQQQAEYDPNLSSQGQYGIIKEGINDHFGRRIDSNLTPPKQQQQQQQKHQERTRQIVRLQSPSSIIHHDQQSGFNNSNEDNSETHEADCPYQQKQQVHSHPQHQQQILTRNEDHPYSSFIVHHDHNSSSPSQKNFPGQNDWPIRTNSRSPDDQERVILRVGAPLALSEPSLVSSPPNLNQTPSPPPPPPPPAIQQVSSFHSASQPTGSFLEFRSRFCISYRLKLADQLKNPVDACLLPNERLIIADYDNGFFLVEPSGHIRRHVYPLPENRNACGVVSSMVGDQIRVFLLTYKDGNWSIFIYNEYLQMLMTIPCPVDNQIEPWVLRKICIAKTVNSDLVQPLDVTSTTEIKSHAYNGKGQEPMSERKEIPKPGSSGTSPEQHRLSSDNNISVPALFLMASGETKSVVWAREFDVNTDEGEWEVLISESGRHVSHYTDFTVKFHPITLELHFLLCDWNRAQLTVAILNSDLERTETRTIRIRRAKGQEWVVQGPKLVDWDTDADILAYDGSGKLFLFDGETFKCRKIVADLGRGEVSALNVRDGWCYVLCRYRRAVEAFRYKELNSK